MKSPFYFMKNTHLNSFIYLKFLLVKVKTGNLLGDIPPFTNGSLLLSPGEAGGGGGRPGSRGGGGGGHLSPANAVGASTIYLELVGLVTSWVSSNNHSSFC